MSDGNFEADIVRWRRQWRRSGYVSGTLDEYIKQMRMFNEWCASQACYSTSLDAADRYISSIEDRSMHSARWAARALRAYGRYLVNDEQATTNPFKNLKLPVEPEPTRALTASAGDLTRLLATCKPPKTRDGQGALWTHVRDRAIILTLAHTALRRAELCQMTIDNTDLTNETIFVPTSKTKKPRSIALHPDAAGAILKYLRASGSDRPEGEQALWLSTAHRPMVALKPTGLSQMLARKGKAVGVDVRAHGFRRMYAGQWMAKGGSESGLMMMCGWSSAAMVRRYSKDSAEANAILEARRLFNPVS